MNPREYNLKSFPDMQPGEHRHITIGGLTVSIRRAAYEADLGRSEYEIAVLNSDGELKTLPAFMGGGDVFRTDYLPELFKLVGICALKMGAASWEPIPDPVVTQVQW